MYLALVLSKTVQPQGMTQQWKWEQMKLKWPMRKAPPIAETRKKFCLEGPKNVQKELYQLLEEFADLFLEQPPKGRPPKREVEFRNQNRGRGCSAKQATLSRQSQGAG